MSFVAGGWIFVNLSRHFVKTQSSALVRMSMDKLSGLNGGLPGSTKLRKQQESQHVHHAVRKWRIKVLLFWLLVALAIGSSWILLSFGDGPLRRKPESPEFCEKMVQVLLQYFNVSKNQLHDLASLFSVSDQIASFECTKEPGPEMQMLNAINCALNLLCSKRQDFPQQGKWEAENIGPNGQCSVQDEGTFRKLDYTVARESLAFLSENEISSCSYHFGKENMLPSEAGYYVRCHCKILSLVIRFWWILIGMITSCILYLFRLKFGRKQKHKSIQLELVPMQRQHLLQLRQQPLPQCPPQGAGTWRKKLLVLIVFLGILTSIWLFWHLNEKTFLRRQETLANMCDERARMLQDQFNVSMNHVNALAILVSTFHHGKDPSAIDQKTFGEYTERTAFERPLTSGVAYALKVPHSKREQFEMQHGWTIKKMETEDQSLVQDCILEKLDPAPIKDEYAPVIFAQETVSHIVSIDMMSGKEDRENILRARASGKGVLTSPFKLLKSNHLGVVLTFAVYKADLPPHATPEQRIEATVGYLGASYDVPSLVEKLLHQLASKQTIVVNVYDTTNTSAPVLMYGTVVADTGLLHISHVDFGDPMRKHEMHCRFKQKPPLPWMAINAAAGVLVITLLIGHIFHAAINRIAKVEEDYHEMMELKVRAEAADVAKSQFLATVSHEIRTPMNGVLGMLQMLMNTSLDESQMDYAQTAHNSGKDLISLINEVLEQAKIESGRLELEAVPFDLHFVLDEVLSLFSGKSIEKGIELAVYVSNQVPEVVVGDPGRFRQIITNLVGNSIKFTNDKGHIFVSVHLVEEARNPFDVNDVVLKQGLASVQDVPCQNYNTLSGFPVVNRWKGWENFGKLDVHNTNEEPEIIRLLVTVEDTGVGIPPVAQCRIFTPFMQADSSTSRTYGGTGIGLSISKHLVELMGGEIGFVSECLIGSAFSFTASFRKGVPSSMDTRWQPYNPAILEFQGWKALVIDKRSIRAEVTRYHLHRLSINVYIASSLQSASCYLSSGGSASVPADLAMVLIDKDVWNEESRIAFQHFLEELKRIGGPKIAANLPKIFLLANTMSPVERAELKSSGLADYVLMKPLRLSILIASFQEAFGNGKKNQVNRKKPSTLRNLLKGKQILVVDDNKVNRRVAEGALKNYGAIVTCVESGKAAIEMLKPPHSFDACFMDRQMPEMDGFEATRQIRSIECQFNEQIESGEASVNSFGNEVNWHAPILAMTADVMQATKEECLKCGMDGYVSKPFEEEQLYDAVAPFFESS